MAPGLLCLTPTLLGLVFVADFFLVLLLPFSSPRHFCRLLVDPLVICLRPDSSFLTPAVMDSQLNFLLFGNCSIEAPTRADLDNIAQYLPLLKAFDASLKTRTRSYFLMGSLLNNN